MRRPKTLWKSRSVEKPKNRLFHRAWKSRPVRGIPTFPQRRRRLDELQQPDISLATKSGHFNLLRTGLVQRVNGQWSFRLEGKIFLRRCPGHRVLHLNPEVQSSVKAGLVMRTPLTRRSRQHHSDNTTVIE